LPAPLGAATTNRLPGVSIMTCAIGRSLGVLNRKHRGLRQVVDFYGKCCRTV